MTCPTPTFAADAVPARFSDSGLRSAERDQKSGPVLNTETPPESGIRGIITRHAAKMRFPNDIQRQRFIDKTLILSRGA